MLTPAASIEFLRERTQGSRRVELNDATAVVELATELDGLPLALEQAAAFLVAKQESFGGYLARWRAHEQKVRQWHDAVRMQYPVSIAVTWDTSFEQLDAGSRALLHLLSWFAPDPIPVSVWQTPTAEQAIADVAESLRDSDLGRGATELQDAEDARAGLWRYGLIQWTEGRSAFRVHRLVQAVTRERLPEAERTLTLQAALHVLDAYLPADPPPEDVRSWPLWHPVRVHVATLIKRADQHGITQPTGLSERDVDAEILDVHAEASGRRPANGL